MGQVEGLTISATSAMAPKDARKAYEKGSKKLSQENGTKPNRCWPRRSRFFPGLPSLV
jgi:hypothetical protein